MKILYIAHERRAAQVVAQALRRIAPDARLTWAPTSGTALSWLRDHHDDVRAVIVDAGTQTPARDTFLEQVRSLGVTAPIAVIAPEHLEALAATLETHLDAAVVHERDKRDILAAHLKEIEESRRQTQADHEAALARITRICTGLQERLLELEAALRGADERGAAQTAATEQLARREAELSAALAEAVAVRTAVEQRLADADAAHQQAHRRAVEELAAANERYALVDNRLTRETSVRMTLEDRLAAVELVREDANQKHAAELASLTARLVEREAQHDAREAQHDASLARASRIGTALQERLLELEAAIRAADERHTADMAASERLALRERELGAALADAIAGRTSLEHRLADIETAYQRAAADLTSASARRAAFEEQLSKQATARSMLEQRLAAAETARRDADQQHAAEVASLSKRLADVQAQYDAATSQHAALERQLRESIAAVDEARRDWKLEVAGLTEQLARREAEANATLADAIAARTAVERRLSEIELEHQQSLQRAAAEATAAAERYAALEDRLSQADNARATLEERLTAAETANQNVAQQHATELASMTTRLADLQAQLDRATEQLRQREIELNASLAEATAARTAVEDRLAEAQVAHQHAQLRSAQELAGAAERYAAIEDRLSEAFSTRTEVEQRLAAAETARQDGDQQHATELASLTARLADLQTQYEAAAAQTASVERQLSDAATAFQHARRDWQSEVTASAEQAARRETELNAALAAAIAARTAVEKQLDEARAAHQQALARGAADLAQAAERRAAVEAQAEAGSRDLAQLQRETDALRRQLDAVRKHAAALQLQARRVGMLQLQLERTQKEHRRQFERGPYGLFECTRSGGITRVNHSLARLLGYQNSTDLQGLDVVATVFESAADLQWLVERALRTGAEESVETTFRTRDSRRLFVRLHALARHESIVIAVEDLTSLRAVEQRLREAERLEAVGRVASEVAVTCDTLLRDVSQGGRQWLAGLGSDTSLRQQGELLLGDVTRAAGFLRQFVAYGHKQISNIEPVSMPRVLHDLAPVLKRVLGDDISLMLPKTTDRFDVDVDAERVERILVNVANYARERMPRGGRVKIQLATTVVDRRFLASYPKVRPGAHVLITITEIRGAVWPPLPVHLPIARGEHAGVPRPAREKPGMDLGPLMALISDLGGHLWMSAEPAGNMTLQIHLPKRTQDEVLEPAVSRASSNRGRQFARWFRH